MSDAIADGGREMRSLNPRLVAELADIIDPRYRALVLLGAYGGFRVGEVDALRRSSVQLPQR